MNDDDETYKYLLRLDGRTILKDVVDFCITAMESFLLGRDEIVRFVQQLP